MRKTGKIVLITFGSLILLFVIFCMLFVKVGGNEPKDGNNLLADSPFAKNHYNSHKLILINFWATWCEGCIEEFPDLEKVKADYDGKLEFIAFSMDLDTARLVRYLDRHRNFKDVDQTLENIKYRSTIAKTLGIEGKQKISGISMPGLVLPYTVLLKNKEILYSEVGTFDNNALRKAIERYK